MALIGFCIIAMLYLIITSLVFDGFGAPKKDYISFSDGWAVYADGKLEAENVTLPYFVENENAKIIDIYNTIPNITNYQVTALQFLVFQKDIKVFVDEKQIYENVFKPTILNKTVPGSITNVVTLPYESAGKQIHIQIDRVVMADKGPVSTIKLIDGAVKSYNRVQDNNVLLVLMVSLASMGVLALFVSLLFHRSWINIASLLCLSIVLISISVWTLCNSRMIELFTTNRVLMHNLEYISFYSMPLALVSFVKHNWKVTSKTIKFARNLSFGFVICTLALKVFLNIDFFVFLTLFHLLVPVIIFTLVAEIVFYYTKRKRSFKVLCAGFIILAVSVVLDLVNFYSRSSAVDSSANIFIFGLVALSVSSILSFILATKEKWDDSFNFITQTNLAAEHRRYEMLITNTKDIFMDWKLADGTVYFSNRFEEYFGVKPFTHNVVENTKKMLSFVEFDKDIFTVYDLVAKGSSEERVVGHFIAPDKTTRWFENIITSIIDSEGKPINIIGIIRDITKERTLADSYASQSEYMQINKELYDNILEADITENIVIGDNGAQLMKSLGLHKKASFSETVKAVSQKLTHEDFKDEYVEILSRERMLSLFENNITSFLYECMELTDGENYKWIRLNVRIYRSEISGTIRIITYVKNIHDEKMREFALVNSSQNDSLSGLLNKGATKEHINEFLDSQNNKLSHAFIMIDVDKFKNINDTFGHALGDTVITSISQKLKAHFRESDIVGRIGGDEFVVFVKNFVDEKTIFSKCDELLKDFDYICKYNGKECQVTLSIGVSIYPGHGTTYDELYKNADIALYNSKNSGRNQYTFFRY